MGKNDVVKCANFAKIYIEVNLKKFFFSKF